MWSPEHWEQGDNTIHWWTGCSPAAWALLACAHLAVHQSPSTFPTELLTCPAVPSLYCLQGLWASPLSPLNFMKFPLDCSSSHCEWQPRLSDDICLPQPNLVSPVSLVRVHCITSDKRCWREKSEISVICFWLLYNWFSAVGKQSNPFALISDY